MNLRVLLIDDEALARDRLRFLLQSEFDVEVVGECRNGQEAIAALRTNTVDLVFLDIQMPGESGFDIIEAVGQQNMPITVFTTAYNKYAMQAFEVRAVDYLTKPIEPERLTALVARVREQLAGKTALKLHRQIQGLGVQSEAEQTEAIRFSERLLIPTGIKDLLVPVKTIVWIEAADYCVKIHVGTKTHVLRETIKDLAAMLDPSQFVRIHRSTIVNIRFVQETLREGVSDAWVMLTTGERLKMSKSGWNDLVRLTQLAHK